MLRMLEKILKKKLGKFKKISEKVEIMYSMKNLNVNWKNFWENVFC